MGPGMGYWVGTGIALPSPPTVPTTPGTPPPHSALATGARVVPETKYGRGLISVDQLLLSAQISDIQGFTEVYNL